MMPLFLSRQQILISCEDGSPGEARGNTRRGEKIRRVIIFDTRTGFGFLKDKIEKVSRKNNSNHYYSEENSEQLAVRFGWLWKTRKGERGRHRKVKLVFYPIIY